MSVEQPARATEKKSTPAWVIEIIKRYALDVKPPATSADLRSSPELVLLAYYIYTRQRSVSRNLARLAEVAVIEQYRGLVRSAAGGFGRPSTEQELKNTSQDLSAQVEREQSMWTALFAAIEKYDPATPGADGRTASFRTYVQNHLTNVKGEIVRASNSGPTPRSEAARLYARIRDEHIRLRNLYMREPTVAEIATAVAADPAVSARANGVPQAYDLAMEALLTLFTPVESADEQPDEGDEAPPPRAIPSDLALPEAIFVANEDRLINRDLLVQFFDKARQRLGIDGARQLFVLRILLSVSKEDLPQYQDPHKLPPPRPAYPKSIFNLRTIAARLNRPRPDVRSVWAWIWIAWELWHFELPDDWDAVRALFPQRRWSERDLASLYSFTLKRSGLQIHARMLDDAELFMLAFRASDLYRSSSAAWQHEKSANAASLDQSTQFDDSTEAGLALKRFHRTVCRLIWNRDCYALNIRNKISQYFKKVRQEAELPVIEQPLPGPVSEEVLARCDAQLIDAAHILVAKDKVRPTMLAQAVVSILLVAPQTLDS